ncbi:haloacid dehalogenase [Annulohypoxylon stygium]|nr:haloacid dehalogenase [Annulohypoxylon stygium]
MAPLLDFRVLSFDVYGTLIDWETGMVTALQPLLDKNGASFSKQKLLEVIHELEKDQQVKTPGMRYADLLATIHPRIAAQLGLAEPTADESREFGDSVGHWPAFPDTVDALRRLSKHYKFVVLSNVDRESFSQTNAGPLQGVPFELILTAQDIGSYKPDPRNFAYMLSKVKEEFGVEKEQVLQTAQSQFHDHHPAKEAGIRSCWIVRPGARMGNREKEVFDWRFDTLGAMADAVEAESA